MFNAILFVIFFLNFNFATALTPGSVESDNPAVKSIAIYYPVMPKTRSKRVSEAFGNLLFGKDVTKNFKDLKTWSAEESPEFETMAAKYDNYDDFWQNYKLNLDMMAMSCSGVFINSNTIKTAWHCIENHFSYTSLSENLQTWIPIKNFFIFIEEDGLKQASAFMKPELHSDVVYIKFKDFSTQRYLEEGHIKDLDLQLNIKDAVSEISGKEIEVYGYGLSLIGIHNLYSTSQEILKYKDLEFKSDAFKKNASDLINARSQKRGRVKIEELVYKYDGKEVFEIVASGNINSKDSQCGLLGDSGGPLIYNNKVYAVTSHLVADKEMTYYMKYYGDELKPGDKIDVEFLTKIFSEPFVSVNGYVFCTYSLNFDLD